MKKGRIIAAFVLLGFALSPIAAQDRSGDLTIEELYLQNAEIRLIREQAVMDDRDSKLVALENIQEMLDGGRLSEGAPEALFILDYLAAEGLSRTVKENNHLVNYYPEVRRRAVNLLGQVGGEGAKDSLIDVLLTDVEPMVLAEAAYALGTLGLNQNNETTRALAHVLLSQDIVAPDNNFAFASLLAFEKIAEANNGIDDTLTFEAIIHIAQGSYIRSVKLKAVEVLDLLRSYTY